MPEEMKWEPQKLGKYFKAREKEGGARDREEGREMKRTALETVWVDPEDVEIIYL
jgi:hypothetical protein